MFKLAVLALLIVGCSAYRPWHYAIHRNRYVHWTYSNQLRWLLHYPDCRGKQQSPINVVRADTVLTKAEDINFINYASKLNGGDLELSNNGHSANLAFTKILAENRPQITGGILGNQTYVLEQIHFHWGAADRRGSDHAVDGKHYSVEGHLVHHNINYKSVADAAGKKDGLVVLGFLYHEDSVDQSLGTPITDLLPLIQVEGKNITLSGDFETGRIFPVEKQKKYFNYDGSLTTPGCSENVNWILFDAIQGIRLDELQGFRNLKNERNAPLADNFRKLQKLNKRVVRYINTE